MQLAKKFIAAYCSPNSPGVTINDIKYPDGLYGKTVSYGKTFTYTVSADANGNCFLYLLPAAELPVVRYDTSTKLMHSYTDPNMAIASFSSQPWFKQQGVYGFRCLGQAMTVYNDTAEIYQQGSVTAGITPATIDNCKFEANTGSATFTSFSYFRNLDNLPYTTADLVGACSKPYVGKAKEGVYLVNRNQNNDFSMIYRDGKFTKGSGTDFYQGGVDSNFLAQPYSNMLTFLPPGETVPQIMPPIAGLNSVTAAGIVPSLRPGYGIDGWSGNRMSVCIAMFSGLSSQTTLTLKITHMYEFQCKVGSPMVPLSTPAWPHVAVKSILYEQLKDKDEAYPASANFFGALLKGLNWVIPKVAPLAAEGVKWVIDKLANNKKGIIDKTSSMMSDLTNFVNKKSNEANPKTSVTVPSNRVNPTTTRTGRKITRPLRLPKLRRAPRVSRTRAATEAMLRRLDDSM